MLIARCKQGHLSTRDQCRLLIPSLSRVKKSSRSSLECSPPCHGGDMGSNPIEDAVMTRYASWKSGEAQTFVILWVRLPPVSLSSFQREYVFR
jgi:hypothetical protein